MQKTTTRRNKTQRKIPTRGPPQHILATNNRRRAPEETWQRKIAPGTHPRNTFSREMIPDKLSNQPGDAATELRILAAPSVLLTLSSDLNTENNHNGPNGTRPRNIPSPQRIPDKLLTNLATALHVGQPIRRKGTNRAHREEGEPNKGTQTTRKREKQKRGGGKQENGAAAKAFCGFHSATQKPKPEENGAGPCGFDSRNKYKQTRPVAYAHFRFPLKISRNNTRRPAAYAYFRFP